MFNDCHCVIGLRRRYERISLMGQVVSVHVERSCSECFVLNIVIVYGSRPRCVTVV